MELYTTISSINREQWQALVNRSPVASVFQTPEMYDFYHELQLYSTTVCAIEEKGVLKGLILCLIQSEGHGIRGRLTARAIINGGPLLDDDISSEAIKTLLKSTVAELKQHCIYIETRNLNSYARWKQTFETCGFSYLPHYNYHIDVSKSELVDKRMDKSRRRRIRRAKENGVSINCDCPDIKGFYDILSNLYRTKIHKPLPPFSMFEQLGQMSFAKYFIVKDTYGKTIGGQLILVLNQRVAYAWYCCGLDKEYHDLYPSIMANYAAIHYAAENGFERYDMMGAGKPGEDYGVRDFKAQFGGNLVEHGRFLHVCRPVVYWLGSKAIAFLKYLQK